MSNELEKAKRYRAVLSLNAFKGKHDLLSKPDAVKIVLETVVKSMFDSENHGNIPNSVNAVLKNDLNALCYDNNEDDLTMAKSVIKNALAIIEKSSVEDKEYIVESFKEILNGLK